MLSIPPVTTPVTTPAASPVPPAVPPPVRSSTQPAPGHSAAHRRLLRGLGLGLRWVAAAALLVGSIVLLAWLTLYWGILPHLNQWRPQLEQQASRVLGVPVKVDHISVTTRNGVPTLTLHKLRLLDAEGRTALVLAHTTGTLSPRSLLAPHPGFEQLRIDRADLDIRRDAQGRIFAAGVLLGTPGQADSPALDWLFSQRDIVLLGGTLRWTDAQRQAPPLALSEVQAVLRNGLRSHDLRLDATPPAGWGERFTLTGRFNGPLLGRRGDVRQWRGELHAQLPWADVAQLRQHVDLPFDVRQGRGAVRAWVQLDRGVAQGATVDLALRDMALRFRPTLAPLVLQEVQGRWVGERRDDRFSLQAQQLAFVTGDGVRWPAADLQLSWRQRPGELATGGEFTAQRLDLATLAALAARVPLGASLNALLAELRPEGRAQNVVWRWQGPIDAPTHYQLRGQLADLALAARPAVPSSASPQALGRPGLRGAALDLQATERGGSAQLRISDGHVDVPGVFHDPRVPLQRLQAQLGWRIDPPSDPSRAGAAPQISVQAQDVRFANADVQGEFNAQWSTGPGSGTGAGARLPGRLALSGLLRDGVASRVARYLPLGVGAEARDYVARAVQGGTVTRASFRVQGDLWDFPFHLSRRAGDAFLVNARIDGGTLAYVPAAAPGQAPDWPAMSQVAGELVFDRASLAVRNAQAQVWGVQLSHINGGVADLMRASVLKIDGQAHGPAADMLRYVGASPVGAMLDGALAEAQASGDADLRLGLVIPLLHADTTTVSGQVQLAGNDVRLRPHTPLLAAARGRVEFTEHSLRVAEASAQLLGGELRFEGGSERDGALRFSGQGTATAEALRQASDVGALPLPIAQRLSGQARYELRLGWVNGAQDLLVTSDGVGLGVDLPAPLHKPAEQPMALRFQHTEHPDNTAPATGRADRAEPAARPTAGPPLRDTLLFQWGSALHAEYQRDLSGATPRVLRGGIGVWAPAPQPARGVHLVAQLPAVSVDAWEAVLAPRGVSGGGSAAAAGSPAPTRPADAALPGYWPTRIALQAQALSWGPRTVRGLVAGISHDDDGLWRATVAAEQGSGSVAYRAAAAGSPARVQARLARWSLPPSDAAEVEHLLSEPPASVPALDIVVDDFELRGKRLGRLEVNAVNRSTDTGAREWRLNALKLSTPEAEFAATGRWAIEPGVVPPRRSSALDFKLDIADSGALLERLGAGRTIRGGKGEISGQLGWAGSPLSLDFASLGGQVKLAIDAGQFLKADAGAGRLLGVLSLQALPRRLALDFRDVFQEGFAFDALTGDFDIRQGVAHTHNLRMRGVQAAVLMEGTAQLARETQDLRVVVVPDINAGGASLAYAAINPAVGLGTFLAQMFLRRPLAEAGTREFRVTGAWADPKIDKIERPPGEAVPLPAGAAEPASAAASASR